MKLNEYLDISKLEAYVREGIVDRKYHKFLPLVLYCHSKRCTFENIWDDVTTKCRGLIVDRNTGDIVARPFEKFFNLGTTDRPETWYANLPNEQPFVSEKLDGSLGTLYRYEMKDGNAYTYQFHGIATKGSFDSDQALWATRWYEKNVRRDAWPEGYTPVFEIIAESVQHHVVTYNGHERLVLIALIDNETGEEAHPTVLDLFARLAGVECAVSYDKTLEETVLEDRENAEGYVISYPRDGQPPLKIKVKHNGFLALQQVVHRATGKAILEALMNKQHFLLQSWIEQTNETLGRWVQGWVAALNGAYGQLLLEATNALREGLAKNLDRKAFAIYIRDKYPFTRGIIFAMLDGKDHEKLVWKAVKWRFREQLSRPFALGEDEE